MKNHWLERRRLKSKPLFRFELIGLIPNCKVDMVKKLVGGNISVVSTDANFVKFASKGMKPSGVDAMIWVFDSMGHLLEVWSMFNVKIIAHIVLGFTNQDGVLEMNCSNMAAVKSKYF